MNHINDLKGQLDELNEKYETLEKQYELQRRHCAILLTRLAKVSSESTSR